MDYPCAKFGDCTFSRFGFIVLYAPGVETMVFMVLVFMDFFRYCCFFVKIMCLNHTVIISLL